MMPTFPRSSLSFRTAGFPQYGWKAGFPGVAFLESPVKNFQPTERESFFGGFVDLRLQAFRV